MRRRLAGIVVATVGLCCWTGNGLPGDSSPEKGMMTDELARRVVGEISPEVERLRGLTFKETVEVSVIDDAAARQHVMDRLRQFEYVQRLAVAEEAYALLGLLPPGTDLLKSLLGVLEEQAGGFYDPPRGAQAPTPAHHAGSGNSASAY